MRRTRSRSPIQQAKITQHAALAALLVMGGFAIAGPSGLLAWSENLRVLDQREAQLAKLQAERHALENRVALLDPNAADPWSLLGSFPPGGDAAAVLDAPGGPIAGVVTVTHGNPDVKRKDPRDATTLYVPLCSDPETLPFWHRFGCLLMLLGTVLDY